MATDLLDFNSVYADNVMMAINPESLNFAHGSYISSMSISEVTKMSLDQFKNSEVSKLGNGADQYMIRDLSNKQILVLLPDCVLKFKVQGLNEITGQEYNSLVSRGEENINKQVWNSKVPIYSYGSTSNAFTMAIKVPPMKMLFRHVASRGGGAKESIIPINLPPLIYEVSSTHNGCIKSGRVGVFLEDAAGNPDIRHLYFPNVFNGGGLCLGNISRETSSNVKNDYDVTMAAFQVWINSKFNNDLLGPNPPEILKDYPMTPEIEAADIPDKSFKKVLAALKTPDGWKDVQWKALSW